MAVPQLSERGVGPSDGGYRITRRRLLPLLPSAPIALSSAASAAFSSVVSAVLAGCSEPVPTVIGGPQGGRELTVDLNEPLGLPDERVQDVVRVRETVGGKAGYVLVETGSDKKPTVSYVDGDGRKTVLNKEVEPNTSLFNYSLSPDGKTVALAFVRETEKRDNYTFVVPDHVEIVDLASGRKTVLEKDTRLYEEPSSTAPGINPDFGWSPDSRYLSCNLFSSIWDTSSGRSVYKKKQTVDFLWSPKENRVLMFSKGQIYDPPFNFQRDPDSWQIMDFTTGENFTLGYRGSGGMMWSSDGQMIVSASYDLDGRDKPRISLFDKRGREIRSVVFGGEKDRIEGLVWSPNGQYLFFWHNANAWSAPTYENRLSLIALDIQSGKQTIIPAGQVKEHRIFTDKEILFTGNNDIVMLAPSVISTIGPSALVYPPIKIMFLSLDEILNGQVNIAEGRLGSGRAIDLVNGFVSSISENGYLYRQPDGSIMITVSSDGKQQLFRIDPVNKVAKAEGTAVAKMETGKSSSSEQEVEVGRVGDVVGVDGQYYRLLNGGRYLIGDGEALERFVKRSQFKGQILDETGRVLTAIPEKRGSGEAHVIDPMGRATRNARAGGLKIAYFTGLGTGRKPWEMVYDPENDPTFSAIREQLKKQGFGLEDTLFYNYSPNWRIAEGGFAFSMFDTEQDPQVSIKIADDQMTEWERLYPLENRMVICHSFGGIPALFALERHLGTVSNICFIDCPILGISDKNISQALLTYYEEKVAKWLLIAGGIPEYRQRVMRIVQKALERGIGFFTFASMDDRIVGWEGAFVPDSTSTINGAQIRRAWAMGRKGPDLGHGMPLETPELIENVGEIVGQNLAAAA